MDKAYNGLMDVRDEILLMAVAGEEKYDQAVKALFNNPKILAPILKMSVWELGEMTVEEIAATIVEVSGTEAVDGTSAAAVANQNVEMGSLSDKVIFFDVHLKMRNPRLSTDEITVFLFIDIEPQNSAYASRLGYPVIKRALYHVARLLSRQLGIVTEETDYGKLSKCYSIWICNDVPKEQRNTMARFHVNKEDLIGESGDKEEDYDLMEVILIRRGEDVFTDGIFDYLAGLFSSDVERMDRHSHIKGDEKTVEEVKNLGGYGKALAEKSRAIGLEEGQAIGLKKGQEIGKAEERQDIFDRIIKNLMSKDQSITEEEAAEQARELMQ